jgi:hypothetical protein
MINTGIKRTSIAGSGEEHIENHELLNAFITVKRQSAMIAVFRKRVMKSEYIMKQLAAARAFDEDQPQCDECIQCHADEYN